MNAALTRRDWRDHAEHLLRQIEDTRLHVDKMFPNKEYLSGTSAELESVKEEIHKFYGKSLDSLVELEAVKSILKKAPESIVDSNDLLYNQLKKIQQQVFFLQLQTKDLLAGPTRSYGQAKSLAASTYNIGVSFPEFGEVKKCLDDNRKVEQNLLCNYLSMEELDETEEKLAAVEGDIDPGLGQLIVEKRKVFSRLNHEIIEVLGQSSLSSQQLHRVCILLDEVSSWKFKVVHFRYLCDLRDSFRWANLLDRFLRGSKKSREYFEELVSRMSEVKTNPCLDMLELKSRLAEFVKSLERIQDLQFFRVILDPIRNIELTEPTVQELIDFMRSSRWTVVAKHKVATKTMSVAELEELAVNAGEIIQPGVEETLLMIQDLHQKYVSLVLEENKFAQDALIFLENMDENKISFTENQEMITEFKREFSNLQTSIENDLECMPELSFTSRARFCKAFIAIVNCASIIGLKGLIDRDELNDLDAIYGTEQERYLKDHPLVAPLLSLLNEKKILGEFILILRSRINSEEGKLSNEIVLEDKIEMRTADQYINMIFSESNPVDYEKEKAEISGYIAQYVVWEEKSAEIQARYKPIELFEAEPTVTQGHLLSFAEEYRGLAADFRRLRFYSKRLRDIQALQWEMNVLLFFKGKRRKRYEWENLVARGREFKDLSRYWVDKAVEEMAVADKLKMDCHESYLENYSYRLIKAIQERLELSTIDLSEEVSFFNDRYESEEDIYRKITSVVNCQAKFRLPELEKISEEVKTCGIDFEDLNKKLVSTMQVCKAFLGVVKDMKKDPLEVKKAKHLYSSIPLYSTTFASIVKQVETEEAMIDSLNESFTHLHLLTDYEQISKLDQRLGSMKYYNPVEPRMILFKKKVAHLIQIEKNPPGDFHLVFRELKSMRQTSEQYLKVHEEDDEMEVCYSYLIKLERDSEKYLEGLSRITQASSLNRVPRITSTFIDVSQEIFDLQAKVNLRAIEGNNMVSLREADMSKLNKTNSLGSTLQGRRKFDLSTTEPPKMTQIHESREKRIPPQPKERVRETFRRRSEDSDDALDIQSARGNYTMNLKMAIQRNPVLSDTDNETFNLAQTLEKAVFLKSLDGSYMTRMERVMRLFVALTRLRRISKLLLAKEFDARLVLYLSDKPAQWLLDVDNDKGKLSRLISKLNDDALDNRKDDNRREVKRKLIDDKEKERARRKSLLKEEAKQLEKERERERKKEELRKAKQKLVRKRDASSSQDSNSSDGRSRLAKKKHHSKLEAVYNRKSDRRLGSYDRSDDDKHSVENMLKDADRVVESLRDQLKIMNKGEKLENASGMTRAEENAYKIKKIKRSDSRDGGRVGNGSGNDEEKGGDYSIDHPAWSIYKGTVNFELRGLNSMKVQLDFTDMITLESKAKVCSFPKLPDKLDIKGPFEYADFTAQIEKLMKRPPRSFSYLLGVLKSGDSYHNLPKVTVKSNCLFYTKYTNCTKLFVFHRSMMNKSWHDGLGLSSRKIYHSNCEFYWLIVHNLNNVDNSNTLPMMDPHPVYSQNLFDLAAYDGK